MRQGVQKWLKVVPVLSAEIGDSWCLCRITAIIFNKSIIDHINGFDEDMTGDDIILRTKKNTKKCMQDRWRYLNLR